MGSIVSRFLLLIQEFPQMFFAPFRRFSFDFFELSLGFAEV
jgi:hypothetical protein